MNWAEQDYLEVGQLAAVPEILVLVQQATGMGFAAVAHVTEERWLACAVLDKINFGLQPGGELDVGSTLCSEVRGADRPIAIDHVEEDVVYGNHATPKQYGFQSYISVPIRLPDGQFFGTLCAIDPRPAVVRTDQIIGMFEMFAQLIGFQIDSQLRLKASQSDLFDAQQAAKLREQFIAVLGHDLRNPLTAFQSGIRILTRSDQLEPRELKVLQQMGMSATRMSQLVENLMDFARGRLGSGIIVERASIEDLDRVIEQVLDELRTSHPHRVIRSELHISHPVNVDPLRLSQLLSNLVGNAIVHGDPEKEVLVEAQIEAGNFLLEITNFGAPIDADVISRLFEPFERGQGKSDHSGLGLGLYIASRIADAHEGDLACISEGNVTRFTLTMPAGA